MKYRLITFAMFRQDFRKDAYVGYADADVDLALEADLCLERLRGVRLLLRYKEELPGSIRAENVVEHIDESWKVNAGAS